MIFLTIIMIALVSVFLYSPVMACDCAIPKNAEEALEKATAVFRGEVLEIKEEKIKGEKYDSVLISVSEIWKGIDASQVIIYTDWSSCHYNFEVGNEYLVYPYDVNGRLKVINCGRSTEIKYAVEDILELGEGKRPSNLVQLEGNFIGNKTLPWKSVLLVLILTVSIIGLNKIVKRL